MENRLNTLLDLKAENHRLQRKVMEYRSRVPPGSFASTQSPLSQADSMYATSLLHPSSSVLAAPGITCQKVSDPSNYSFDQPGSNFALDFGNILYDANASNNNLEGVTEVSKKKKVSTVQHTFLSSGLLNDNTLSQRRHTVRSSMFVSVDAPTPLNGER